MVWTSGLCVLCLALLVHRNSNLTLYEVSMIRVVSPTYELLTLTSGGHCLQIVFDEVRPLVLLLRPFDMYFTDIAPCPEEQPQRDKQENQECDPRTYTTNGYR